jgi:CheY-like chemotaxis protein
LTEANAAETSERYVLVVDPDVNERYYTCMLLHRFGFKILSVRSAEKAIGFMAVVPPSVVVADEGINGSTLFSWLTQDPRFYDIPLLLLSWWPNAALEERARNGDFAAYLRKPVNVMEFYRIMQTAMEKSRRRNLRIATHLNVRLEDGLGGSDGYATVISEYGMFFLTLHPRPLNTRIPVVIEIGDRIVKLEALVLYTIGFDEGPFKEPGMGLKFVKISRKDRDLIAAFILERIEEGIANQRTQK